MSNKAKTTTPKPDGKPTLTPKLRFPEFRDAEGWREGRITDIAEVLQGYGFPERYQGQTTGEYPFYKVSDISNTLAAGKVFIEESANYITEDVLKELKAKPIPEGTTIFAKIGEAIRSNRRAITTKFCLIDNNAAGVKRIQGKSTDLFVYFTMETISLIDYSGGVVPSVNKSAIENIAVKFPAIGEQQKIAECLSSVDELMAAQARKLDALKTHKKGLMQQLFPREGETQPRLRFPEFQNAGEWEEVRFGKLGLDVSDGNYSSKYPSQSDFVETGVPFLRANNLKFGTVSDADMRFISPQQHSQITKGHLKKGDILITTRGELGIIALVPDRHIGSNINAQIVRINAGNRLVNTFLFQLMDYSRTIGLFDALSTGTALKQLPIGKLNQLSLQIPETPAEQQRIADCLSTLDDLIAAQTQKLDALKTHKKGLMQQLFPSPEEVEA